MAAGSRAGAAGGAPAGGDAGTPKRRRLGWGQGLARQMLARAPSGVGSPGASPRGGPEQGGGEGEAGGTASAAEAPRTLAPAVKSEPGTERWPSGAAPPETKGEPPREGECSEEAVRGNPPPPRDSGGDLEMEDAGPEGPGGGRDQHKPPREARERLHARAKSPPLPPPVSAPKPDPKLAKARILADVDAIDTEIAEVEAQVRRAQAALDKLTVEEKAHKRRLARQRAREAKGVMPSRAHLEMFVREANEDRRKLVEVVLSENQERSRRAREEAERLWQGQRAPAKDWTATEKWKAQAERHQQLRPQLLSLLRSRSDPVRKYEASLGQEYAQRFGDWRRLLLERRRAQEAARGARGNGSAQPLRSSARFRPSMGGVARSEYEEMQIISQLQAAERLKTLVRLPPMILEDNERRWRGFNNNNSLIVDPKAELEREERTLMWDSKEKDIFLEKFMQYPKDFRKIATFLPHRTTADCVVFYYKNQKGDEFSLVRRKQLLKKRRLYAEQRKMNSALPPPPPLPPISTKADRGEGKGKGEKRKKEDKAKEDGKGKAKKPKVDTGETGKGKTQKKTEEGEQSRWSETEQKLLVESVKEVGKDVKAIAAKMGNKSQAAIKAFWAKNKKRLGLESLVEVYNANKSKAKADAKGKKGDKSKAEKGKKGDKAKAGASGAVAGATPGGKASTAGSPKPAEEKPASAKGAAPSTAEAAATVPLAGLSQEILASLSAGGLPVMPPPPNPGMVTQQLQFLMQLNALAAAAGTAAAAAPTSQPMDAATSQLLAMMNPAIVAQLMQPAQQGSALQQQAALLSLMQGQVPIGLQGAGDFMVNVPPPVTGIPGQVGTGAQPQVAQGQAVSVQPSVGEPSAAPPTEAAGQGPEAQGAAQAQLQHLAGASVAGLQSTLQAMSAAQAAAIQSMAPPAVPAGTAAPAAEEAAKPEARKPHYWTDSEKQAFVEVFKAHGRDWKALSARFPEKTLGQLKAFYQNWRKRLELEQYVLPPAERRQQEAGASGEKGGGAEDADAAGIGLNKSGDDMADPTPPTEQADEKAGEVRKEAGGGGSELVQSPQAMEVDKAVPRSGPKSKASAGSDKVATGSEVQEMDVDQGPPDTDTQGAAPGAGVMARQPTGPQTSFLSGVHSGERIARSSVLAELGNEAEDSFVSVEHPGPAVAANVVKPRAAGGLRPTGKAPAAGGGDEGAAKAANPTLSHAQAQALALAHAQAQLQAHALQAQVKAQALAQAKAQAEEGAEGGAQMEPQKEPAEQAVAPPLGTEEPPRSAEAQDTGEAAKQEAGGSDAPVPAVGGGGDADEADAAKGAAAVAAAAETPPHSAPEVPAAPSEGAPGSREGTLVTGAQPPPERAASAARAALSSAATADPPRPPSSQVSPRSEAEGPPE